MKATKDGVSVSNRELRALLRSASNEQESTDTYGVQFQCEGDKVFARAHNGRTSLVFEGECDGKLSGEWFVEREFLVEAKKLLTAKRVARLAFKSASLHEAIIEENGVPLRTLEAEGAGAARSQISFPAIDKNLKLPSRRREIAHCAAVGAAYLQVVQYAAEAVDEDYVEWYPPANPDAPIVFRAGSEGSTMVTGCILPGPVGADEDDAEEGVEAGDEGATPARKRGRRGNSRQQELPAP